MRDRRLTTSRPQAARAAALTAAWALLAALALPVRAGERFPHPEFESGYTIPSEQHPLPDGALWAVLDVAVLAAALVLAAVFVLRLRSRRAVFVLSILSLAWFGFVRKGCVCAVGSLQNVVLALAEPSYAVPFAALAFFLLPLAATLLFGRVFCAAVCPLGAVQDAVVLKPLRVPNTLAAALGLLPLAYLALACLGASTGAAFLVCRYDPFVSLFRFSGSAGILLFGAGLLALGTVVARPYCRFLCPYGVLLGWLQRLARRRASVSPDRCVQCRLCEDACPFDALRAPEDTPAPALVARRARALGALLLLLPALAAASGWLLASLAPSLARLHPEAALADQIGREDRGETAATTDASEAFRASRRPATALFERAARIQDRTRAAGWILGALFGAALGLRLAGLLAPARRTDYETDPRDCLGCARCFDACPRERLRRTTPAGGGTDA